MIYVQRGPQRLIERDAGMRVVGHGLHFRALAGGQIALVLNHLENSGGAQRVAALVGRERLFLKLARFGGGVVAHAGLLQTDHGILHIHRHLVGVLAQIQLVLAKLEQAGGIVGLGRAIAQRNVQRKTRRIIREISPEDLFQQIAVAAGQIVEAGLRSAEQR